MERERVKVAIFLKREVGDDTRVLNCRSEHSELPRFQSAAPHPTVHHSASNIIDPISLAANVAKYHLLHVV